MPKACWDSLVSPHLLWTLLLKAQLSMKVNEVTFKTLYCHSLISLRKFESEKLIGPHDAGYHGNSMLCREPFSNINN